jgi:hypothetical protein
MNDKWVTVSIFLLVFVALGAIVYEIIDFAQSCQCITL